MFKRIYIALIILTYSGVALAAGGAGGGSLLSKEMAYKGINFVLLLVLLHLFVRKPIARMLNSSAENTKKTMDSTRTELEKAKEKLSDFQSKIANLEKELEDRKQAAMSAIEEEKNQIILDAENQVKKLEEQSQLKIEQDTQKAKSEIREFLVNESVKLAEKTVKEEVGKKQKALLDNYSKFLDKTA